jgi:serine protease Do
MKLLRLVGVLTALVVASALALILAPAAYGFFGARVVAHAQGQEPRDLERNARGMMTLAGRGAEIGVRIAESPTGGVAIEEVQPDSPADKAGLKRGDVVLEFDAEHVRSVRQFSRLVAETPPGRTVNATVVRDGQKKDIRITPSEGRGAAMQIDGDRLRGLADLGRLGDRMPPFDFNFDFDLPGGPSGRRLGVTVNQLTDQLAQYFGAKEGLLVTSVAEGSAASRAGLKAGDVITSINGRSVRSRDDLTRSLRNADSDDLTIVVMRDKKESTVKATIDPPRRTRRGAV